MDDPIRDLDGWFVLKGIGLYCYGCGTAFEPGDDVVVSPGEHEGEVEAVFGDCVDCAETTIPPRDREQGYDQYILQFNISYSPQGLVLDGDNAHILDHSPPDDGVLKE
jgi:hypothetical protein